VSRGGTTYEMETGAIGGAVSSETPVETDPDDQDEEGSLKEPLFEFDWTAAAIRKWEIGPERASEGCALDKVARPSVRIGRRSSKQRLSRLGRLPGVSGALHEFLMRILQSDVSRIAARCLSR